LSTTWFFTEKMQLRLAAGSTVSRPTLNEISEARYRDPDTDNEFQGNPELEPADIDSLDLRWEWFPSPAELISVGVFRKDYTNPLEEEFISQAGTEDDLRQVVNADEATVDGVEFTVRLNAATISGPLGVDWGWTDNAYVQGNLALIDSEVTLDDPGIATDKERRLQGQADELFNLQVGYDTGRHDATAVLNYTGDRLDAVGTEGLPNVVEQARTELGATYRYRWSDALDLNLEVENLLDEEVERTQGDQVLEGFNPGVDVTVGLDYRF